MQHYDEEEPQMEVSFTDLGPDVPGADFSVITRNQSNGPFDLQHQYQGGRLVRIATPPPGMSHGDVIIWRTAEDFERELAGASPLSLHGCSRLACSPSLLENRHQHTNLARRIHDGYNTDGWDSHD